MSRFCPKIVKIVVLPYIDMIFIQSSKIVFKLSIPLFHVSLVDFADVRIAHSAYDSISTTLISEYKNFVYVSLALTHSSSYFSTRDNFRVIDSLKLDVLFKMKNLFPNLVVNTGNLTLKIINFSRRVLDLAG